MVAMTSTKGTPSTAACSTQSTLLSLASILQAYLQGRTMGRASASQTSTGSTQLRYSHRKDAQVTLKRSGRMLMAAATVRPPAELPHRLSRPGLVYPSCTRQKHWGDRGLRSLAECLTEGKRSELPHRHSHPRVVSLSYGQHRCQRASGLAIHKCPSDGHGQRPRSCIHKLASQGQSIGPKFPIKAPVALVE